MSTMVICPSITPSAPDPHMYREQIERVSFADRIQIDLMDGIFAPNKNINPIQVWWPDHILADIHLMYERPAEHLETLISLKPHLIILHVEAEGNIEEFIRHIQKFGIKAGVALRSDTSVAEAHGCIEGADHVLLFAGKLGSFGGNADLSVLEKVPAIRSIRSDIEIGWDGGVNDTNLSLFREAGIDVCSVGGFIQRSEDPKRSYETLLSIIK